MRYNEAERLYVLNEIKVLQGVYDFLPVYVVNIDRIYTFAFLA